jgi:cyclopropane-fatty-acyl-phospholipid synthase
MSIANLARYGFEVHDVEGWREHYARTTRLWHDRLLSHRVMAEHEVGSVKFRLWLAYLAGCSLAFENGHAAIFQTLVSKRARGPSGLPLTRADLYAAPASCSELPEPRSAVAAEPCVRRT